MNGIPHNVKIQEYNPYLEAARWELRAQDFQAKLKTKELELADFRQEVSDAAKGALSVLKNNGHAEAAVYASNHLIEFIIPAPKPDPLLAALLELELSSDLQEGQHDAKWIRNKLDELGFEIREKNDD